MKCKKCGSRFLKKGICQECEWFGDPPNPLASDSPALPAPASPPLSSPLETIRFLKSDYRGLSVKPDIRRESWIDAEGREHFGKGYWINGAYGTELDAERAYRNARSRNAY